MRTYPEVDARAGAYELAFDEAGRALDAQERVVGELRSRASVLIATSAIATSFFGGRVVVAHALNGWAWIAVAAFGAVGLCVLLVLWPRRDWEFSASATDIITEYVEPDLVPLPQIHRDLALHRSASYDENVEQLKVLFNVFRFGVVFLVVSVGAWIVRRGTGVRSVTWPRSPRAPRPPRALSRFGPARCRARRAAPSTARPSRRSLRTSAHRAHSASIGYGGSGRS